MGEHEGGQFGPGNTMRITHGGSKAIKALSDGVPLAGWALELEERLHIEIERDGLVAMMRARAERYQAVADLYYALCLGADDAKVLDNFVKRFGWLQSAASRMWFALESLERERDDGKTLDYETILAAQREREGKGNG